MQSPSPRALQLEARAPLLQPLAQEHEPRFEVVLVVGQAQARVGSQLLVREVLAPFVAIESYQLQQFEAELR